jgi:DMSO/TMAO reductase YedYZ molybdopterin-dependent catalytic subunit
MAMTFRQRHWRHAWAIGLLMLTGFGLYLTTWRSALGPLLPAAQDVHELGGIVYGVAVLVWSGVLFPWPGRRARGAPAYTQFAFFLVMGLFVTGVGLLVGPSMTRAIATVGHGAFAGAFVIWAVWHLMASWPQRVVRSQTAGRPGLSRRAMLRWMGGAAVAVPVVLNTPSVLSMVAGRLVGAAGAPVAGGARPGFVPYTVVNGYPRLDLKSWRLSLDQAAGHREWTWAEWQREPLDSLTVNFRCVTGWVVPDVQFGGVNLERWLLRNGWDPSRHPWVNFYSADGVYTESMSAPQIHQHQPILATIMDGAALPVEQGFPMRLYVPRMYGYKSIKWLTRIQLVDREMLGYWEQRGYPENANYGSYNPVSPGSFFSGKT